MNRVMSLLSGVVALLVVAMPARADIIYAQTGTATGVGGNDMFVVSWTQTTAWTDVAISLDLHNFADAGTLISASVFLLDSIGPGTTAAANEVASTIVSSVIAGPQTLLAFSGLLLGAGTFYLAYVRDPATDFLGWAIGLPVVVTPAPDVTPGPTFATSGALAAYAPSTPLIGTGLDFLFSVTGTPAALPESATGLLMFAAAAAAVLWRRRRHLAR